MVLAHTYTLDSHVQSLDLFWVFGTIVQSILIVISDLE